MHSITSHEIHFVYYGCGLCMNALYLGAPPPWVLWPTLLTIDVLHTVSKFLIWCVRDHTSRHATLVYTTQACCWPGVR